MTMPPNAAEILSARPTNGALASLFSLGVEQPAVYSHATIRALRKARFTETPMRKALRIARATKAALVRDGLPGCLAALELMAREKSIAADGLPDPDGALEAPDGLCGVVNDLSVDALMAAFGRGLYPSSHFGPLRWWAPSLRAVVRTADILERGEAGDEPVAMTFDTAFEDQLAADIDDAPLTPRLKWAYAALFDAGFAHCFEAFGRDGARVGSGFGVAVGDVFVLGALRISPEAHARAFLHALAQRLSDLGYEMIDARRPTYRVMALGFAPMPRSVYNARVLLGLAHERIGKWSESAKAA